MPAPYPIPPELVDRWQVALRRCFATSGAFRAWMETPCPEFDDMTPGHVVRVGGAARVVALLEAVMMEQP